MRRMCQTLRSKIQPRPNVRGEQKMQITIEKINDAIINMNSRTNKLNEILFVHENKDSYNIYPEPEYDDSLPNKQVIKTSINAPNLKKKTIRVITNELIQAIKQDKKTPVYCTKLNEDYKNLKTIYHTKKETQDTKKLLENYYKYRKRMNKILEQEKEDLQTRITKINVEKGKLMGKEQYKDILQDMTTIEYLRNQSNHQQDRITRLINHNALTQQNDATRQRTTPRINMVQALITEHTITLNELNEYARLRHWINDEQYFTQSRTTPRNDAMQYITENGLTSTFTQADINQLQTHRQLLQTHLTQENIKDFIKYLKTMMWRPSEYNLLAQHEIKEGENYTINRQSITWTDKTGTLREWKLQSFDTLINIRNIVAQVRQNQNQTPTTITPTPAEVYTLDPDPFTDEYIDREDEDQEGEEE